MKRSTVNFSQEDTEYGPRSFWIGAVSLIMLALGVVSHALPIAVVATVVGVFAWLRFALLCRK